jgi:exopolysaccharide biosynthesis polyprenyl glycosylphosphotransferase
MKHWGHPNRDKVVLLLGDAALLAAGAAASWHLHAGAGSHATHKLLWLCVLLPSFLASMYVFDLYSMAKLNGLGTMVKVAIAMGAASGFCNLFFHLFQWKNPAYYQSLLLCTVIFPAAAYAWRRCYLPGSRQLRPPENLVVVGSPADAEVLCAAMDGFHPQYNLLGLLSAERSWPEALHGHPETKPFTRGAPELTKIAAGEVGAMASGSFSAGTAVALALEPEPDAGVAMAPSTASAARIPDLGPPTSENLLRVVAVCGVRAVVVRSDTMTSELAGVLTRLRFRGIQVYSLLDFCMRVSEELPLEILNESWLCVADGFDLLQARFFRRVKRLGDVLLATVGLLAALPFLLLAAIAIQLDSPGPILFRQRRVGWMGRPFELLKFRSMRMGAETGGRAQWAAVDDPRVTPFGKILRKTHFDELPQMINVLRGEMSFVGPRPERPEFVGLLNESISFYHLRHYVLPGITGWAQVNYPYGASFQDARRKLQYDLYYVCNASPLLDLRTLLRTARVVLFRQGSR